MPGHSQGDYYTQVLNALKNLSTGGIGGESGTTDYNKLQNIPSINGVQLKGNLTLEDIGIPEVTDNIFIEFRDNGLFFHEKWSDVMIEFRENGLFFLN